MELGYFTPIYELLMAIGYLLTQTWPGRLVLGMVVGSMIARIARW
jgi:hypothetical protein